MRYKRDLGIDFNLYNVYNISIEFFKEIDFSMNSTRRKHSMYRILKTISYLAGFPLLVLMVLLGSITFMAGDAYTATKWYGVYVVLGAWLLITLLQIVFSLFCKNYKGRTMFSILLVVIIMTGGSFAFDIYAKGKVDDVRKEYKEYGVTVKEYNAQVNHYVPLSDKASYAKEFNKEIERLMRVYNLAQYDGKAYNKNADKSKIIFDKEYDAYYNENGLHYGGYVFSVKETLHILITYNQVKADYAAKNKDVDKELDKALAKLESDSFSEWSQYKRSKEYLDAYGVDGEAYKYMLTEERLETILGILGANLEGSVKPLLDSLGSIISGLIKDKDGNPVDISNVFTSALSIDTILPIINALGVFGDDAITRAELMDVLKGFSFYQVPTVKPIFAFLEDGDLKDYAYAKYAATVHGANVGSILIGDKLGEVTMDSSGYPSEMGFTLTELYQLRADMEYKTLFYPLFAARRYMYIFSAIIALGFILAYHFGNKERELFKEIYEGKQKRR